MVTPLDGTTSWGKVSEVDLQAVGREKGREKESEAMLEQRMQVVQEGQGPLVLDLEPESGEDLEPGLDLEQGVDPQEGTLQVLRGSTSGEEPETPLGAQG